MESDFFEGFVAAGTPYKIYAVRLINKPKDVYEKI